MDQNVPENDRNLVFYGDAHPNFGHFWTCNCNTVLLRYLKHILECQAGMVNPRKGTLVPVNHFSMNGWIICIISLLL